MTSPSQRQEDWNPLDPADHAEQVRALLRALGKRPRRVLDLGCGDGRTARPLSEAGHALLCVDSDPAAARACTRTGLAALRGDFLTADGRVWASIAKHGPFDAVTCLGHTFLVAADPGDAATLLGRLASVCRPGASLYLDDFAPLWREVADGNWQEGESEDGTMRLQWEAGDNVIRLSRLRRGRRDVQRLRLWSRGELALLARASGWAAKPAAGLLTPLTAPKARPRSARGPLLKRAPARAGEGRSAARRS